LPRLASCYGPTHRKARQYGTRGIQLVRGRYNLNRRNIVSARKGRDAAAQDALAEEEAELLGLAAAGPFAAPSGHN
jgi:hypothetical protein